jgi:hypothetical protein
MEQYDYIKDYRGCSIYQDMDDGAFVAYDDDDHQISREDTLKMVKGDIDKHVGVDLVLLRYRLSKEKSIIDRKLFIINNLINTSRFIDNFKARQRKNK